MTDDWTTFSYIGHKKLFLDFGDEEYSVTLVNGETIPDENNARMVIPDEVGTPLLKDEINIGSTAELKNSLIFSKDDSENKKIISHILAIGLINDNNEKFRILEDQKGIVQSKERGIKIQQEIMHKKFFVFKDVVGALFFAMMVGLSTSFFISGSEYELEKGFFVGLPIAILLGLMYIKMKNLDNKIKLVDAQVRSHIDGRFYYRKLMAEKLPLLRVYWDNHYPSIFNLIPKDIWEKMYE